MSETLQNLRTATLCACIIFSAFMVIISVRSDVYRAFNDERGLSDRRSELMAAQCTLAVLQANRDIEARDMGVGR